MYENLIAFYKCVQLTHSGLYNEMKNISVSLQTASIEELAEVCFVFRKSAELLDDLRKQLSKTEHGLEIVVCKRWIQQDGDQPQAIETEYITAKPQLAMLTSLPSEKTDPEAYYTLLRALEIPEQIWPIISIHWVHFCEYLTELAIAGKPYPGGLDPRKIVPQYKLRLRRKKEITDQDKQLTDEEIPF